jgi:tetraacyldisaccharide 4'-kinase
MERAWLEQREQTPAQRLALLPLAGVSLLWRAAAAVHRGLYRRGWLRERRLECRVVSVGSLLAGGTGKTPVAAWLAARLYERGHRVVLASRGWGRRGREPVCVVSDGRRLCCEPAAAGDEPLVLAAATPGVPVLVGRDRGVVGMRAMADFAAEVLVLDDGHQHHRLRRDLCILTLDADLGFGNGRVLPRGPLREGPAALAAADALIVLDGELRRADEALLARHAPDLRRVRAVRRGVGLRQLAGGSSEAPACLAARKVGMLAGIARPASFRRSLEALGAEVVAQRIFADHHRYSPHDLAGLAAGADTWVTTAKDAVKILPSWLDGLDLRVLDVELEVAAGGDFIDWVEQRLLG